GRPAFAAPVTKAAGRRWFRPGLKLAELRFVARLVASHEEPCLAGPIIAADASLEAAELCIDAVDFRLIPGSDLLERSNTDPAELFGDFGAEALNAGKIAAAFDRGRRRGSSGLGRGLNRRADPGKAGRGGRGGADGGGRARVD